MRLFTRLGWIARLSRTALVAAAVLACIALFPTGAFASTITGILVYDSNSSSGGSMASGGWETPQAGSTNPLTLSEGGSTYGPGAFSIDISALGTYTVDYTAASGTLSGTYADLELFFDGSSSPGITAVINRSSQTTLIAPISSSQYCLSDYTPCTVTSGLQFNDGTNAVTVTGFSLLTVGGDFAGQGVISLDVTGNAPEPATMGLVSASLFAAGLILARRNRNR